MVDQADITLNMGKSNDNSEDCELDSVVWCYFRAHNNTLLNLRAVHIDAKVPEEPLWSSNLCGGLRKLGDKFSFLQGSFYRWFNLFKNPSYDYVSDVYLITHTHN